MVTEVAFSETQIGNSDSAGQLKLSNLTDWKTR